VNILNAKKIQMEKNNFGLIELANREFIHYFPDTFWITFRCCPDSFQALSRELPDTLPTPS